METLPMKPLRLHPDKMSLPQIRATNNYNYKLINSHFGLLNGKFSNAIDEVSERAFDKVVDRAKIDWLSPVDTFDDLAKTYPDAKEGQTVMVRDTGKIYRMSDGVWREIQDIDPTAINEVDARLTENISEVASGMAAWIDENGTMRPPKYQRKLFEPFVGWGDTELFPSAATAPQGLAQVTINGQTKIFMLSRVAGSAWSVDERSRIVEFNLSEDGEEVRPIAYSKPLKLGHQGLSALVENGRVYLFSGANTGGGLNSQKGYSKIEWRGSETSDKDVVTYRLFGDAGSGHLLQDHYRSTPCVSSDGQLVILSTQGTWEGNVRYCVVYNRMEIENADIPAEVMPINVFKTPTPTSDNTHIVQDVASDGKYLFILRGGVHPLGSNVIQIFEVTGYEVGSFNADLSLGDYSEAELLGGASDLGIPVQHEPEGIDVKDGQLLVLSTDVWRQNCPIVSHEGKNYAMIAGQDLQGGRQPNASTDWIVTKKSATQGQWSSSTTYKPGEYSKRGKVVHSLGHRLTVQAMSAKGIFNAVQPRQSTASVHIPGSAIDVSIPYGDAFQMAQYSELGQFFRYMLTINNMNSFRFYDFRDGADNLNHSSITVVRHSGRVYTEIRAKSTHFEGGGINLYGSDDSTGVAGSTLIYSHNKENNESHNVRLQATGAFRPGKDGTQNLGTASYRWNNIYGSSDTINTSDRRLKQDIKPIPNEVLDAWADVEFVQYRFKDAVLEKGDDARIHVGLIAQNIYEVFEAHGLSAFDYGLIGYDEWPAQEEVRDESGNIVQESRKAGSIWSVRFDECQFLELALQRREMERLKAQLDSLEK
ncbi:tail fiber domain-containing protein [Shouchella clausii]|uniref:tail fiber domain-containing protein n=1 Tax=Shouchella clausii TaxID=79880 RepID=UPI000BA5CAF8|nr:tail fiber domain-containing protein [Shouchella clausii]PAD17414.1 hypothetical protein CHH74_01960 [Shouchella clausii]